MNSDPVAAIVCVTLAFAAYYLFLRITERHQR